MSEPKPSSRFRFREYVLTGIFALIPLSVTLLVIKFFYDFLAAIAKPATTAFLAGVGADYPLLTELLQNQIIQTIAFLVLLLAALYLLGFITSQVVGERVIALVDAIMTRIPFIESVYGATKKLVDMLKSKPGGNLQRVVLVNFPNDRMKAVGFVTRRVKDSVSGRELAMVYVPTAPNPTSGYMEIIPVEDIISTDWTMDQAMSYILSAGAVAPEKVAFSKPDKMA